MATSDRDERSSTPPGSSRASRWSRSRRPARSSPTRPSTTCRARQYGALFLPQVVTAITGVAARREPRPTGSGRSASTWPASPPTSSRWSLLVVSQFVTGDQALAYAAAAGRDGVPRRRLRPDRPGAEHASPRRSTRRASTAPCSCSTRCSAWARRWRRCSSRSSSGSASGGACRCSSAILLAVLVAVSVRLPLQIATRRRDGDAGASAAIPRRFWLYAGFAVLYGVCETMNGNWSQLDMTSELGASTTAASLALTAFWAMVTVGRVLFAAIERAVPAAAHVPRAAVRARRRVRAHRAAPGRPARARRRRVRPRRARVLGAAAADDQLRPGGARRRRGGRGGRCDRLLPARLRHRRLRRRAAARRAASSCRPSTRWPRSSPWRWARGRSSSPAVGRRPSWSVPGPGAAMTGPSGEQVEIVLRRPARGRRRGGRRVADVLASAAARSSTATATTRCCRSGRGQVLIPWPNRLEDGSYEFDGRRHQVPIDDPAENERDPRPGPLGGVDGRRARAGVRRDGALLHPRPGYPFSLALRIEYALSDAGLSVTTTATNVGPDPCPYGGGAHPYLTLGTERSTRSSYAPPAARS